MITQARTIGGLPGIALPGLPAQPRPQRLLAPGTLLLKGATPDQPMAWDRHRRQWGDAPALDITALIDISQSLGLVGAGGAEFPTERKLRSVAGQRVAAVVVNGAEGETASAKDTVLLTHVPHLVLDGALVIARALGTGRVVVYLAADQTEVIDRVRDALLQRAGRDPLGAGIDVVIRPAPPTFVAGEASAVVNALSGGAALPADLGKPPMLRKRFGRRDPVFLSNVETFARVAVAVRGVTSSSALGTASGAVRTPGVLELPVTSTLGDLADAVGLVGSPDLLITGGWHGRWVRWPQLAGTPLDRRSVADAGGRWGAGAFVWLPDAVPPQQVLQAVTRHLAAESAGQCGPCVRGLPAIADSITGATDPVRPISPALAVLFGEVSGRGLCAHPTATVEAVRSALGAIASLAQGATA